MHSNPITKQSDTGDSTSIKSRVVSIADALTGEEETEIAAQLSLPCDGGWGWVVVVTGFCCSFILDGITFTFGSLLTSMSKDLKVSDSLVALLSSIQIAMYFMLSPFASALINRCGFRACAMTGSVICSMSLFTSQLTDSYAALCVFYGLFSGFGSALIGMSAGLVAGFYFEKRRALALALTTSGSSCGIMGLSPINVYLVKLKGWRSVTLFHSGLMGLVFFLGMTFRPLVSLTFRKPQEASERTITFLPNLSTPGPTKESLTPTRAERFFSAISNVNFPTGAALVEEGVATTSTEVGQPDQSKASKLTLIANSPQGSLCHRYLKQGQSVISIPKIVDKTKINEEINIQIKGPEQRGCCARLCHWFPHVSQARPMYRDDAFYAGSVKNLATYKKSTTDTQENAKTGLEYQLAVSRATTIDDLTEDQGVFTTSIRRVLASMLEPSLLKKLSFILLCCNGFLAYVGLLVPYFYVGDRNEKAGIAPEHCALFVSVMGLSNAIGRLFFGWLADKIDPLKIVISMATFAGISTIISDLSFSVIYQYCYCIAFGYSISGVTSLRSVVLVSLYGLEKLTNATGMLFIFIGVGNLFSTPLAGILKSNFGYGVAFYTSGVFIAISGLIVLPIRIISKKENETVGT